MIEQSRRGFIAGIGALFVAAPAIVRASSLMPVKAIESSDFLTLQPELTLDTYAERILGPLIDAEAQQAARNLLTIDMITRKAIKPWTNSNKFLQELDLQYEKEFQGDLGYWEGMQWVEKPVRIGTTIRVRLPNDYKVKETPLVLHEKPIG